MSQELKKKIMGFITDERGTISKQNLIKGAITLSAIAASVSVVHAKCVVRADTKPTVSTLSGLTQGSEQDNAINSCGLVGDTTQVKWTCTTDNYKTTCNSKQICPRNSNRNTYTNGKYVHKNANAAMHTNNLNLDYNDKRALFKGVHGHHGQHDKFNACCEQTPHTNHCRHCKHSDGGM